MKIKAINYKIREIMFPVFDDILIVTYESPLKTRYLTRHFRKIKPDFYFIRFPHSIVKGIYLNKRLLEKFSPGFIINDLKEKIFPNIMPGHVFSVKINF